MSSTELTLQQLKKMADEYGLTPSSSKQDCHDFLLDLEKYTDEKDLPPVEAIDIARVLLEVGVGQETVILLSTLQAIVDISNYFSLNLAELVILWLQSNFDESEIAKAIIFAKNEITAHINQGPGQEEDDQDQGEMLVDNDGE